MRTALQNAEVAFSVGFPQRMGIQAFLGTSFELTRKNLNNHDIFCIY